MLDRKKRVGICVRRRLWLVLFLASTILLSSCFPHDLIDSDRDDERNSLGFSPEFMLWSPQGDWLALTDIRTDLAQSEGSQIYLYDLQRAEVVLLVDSGDIFTDLVIQFWSPDGQYLYFSSGGGDLFREGIWKVDVYNSLPPEYVWAGDTAALSPSGNLAIFSIDILDHLTNVTIFSSETMKVIASYTLPGLIQHTAYWSNDGNYLLFGIYEREADNKFLVILNFISGEIIEIHEDEFLKASEWSPLGSYFSFIKFESLHLSDSIGQCTVEILSGVEGLLYTTTWSPDGRQLAYEINERIEFIDLGAMFGDALFSDDFPCNVEN